MVTTALPAGDSLVSLRTTVIRALTMAANIAIHRDSDFADFLAQVLAATAANVGGPERLLAGRPGSWESGLVEDLLRGTVGDDPDSWWTYRTEPLFITLHVAELIESGELHPGLLGLEDAIDAVGERYDSVWDDEEALLAWDVEVGSLTQRYKTEYANYAERFAAAARAAGQTMSVPVDVIIVAAIDPNRSWWDELDARNPTEFDADPLAVTIWHAAHDTVPLPNVDIRWTHMVDRPTGERG